MPLDLNILFTAVVGLITGLFGHLSGRRKTRAEAAEKVAAAEATTAATAAGAAELWKQIVDDVREQLKATQAELEAVRQRVDDLERHRDEAALLRGFIARAHRYYRGGGTVPYPVPDDVARLVWPERYVEALSTGPIAIGEHIQTEEPT